MNILMYQVVAKLQIWICNNFLQRKHFYNQQEAENAFQEVIESWNMDFYATGIKLISYWQKKVSVVMTPILIHKDMFEPS